MIVLIMLLLAFGTVMVFSASYAYALASSGDSRLFISNQLKYVALGTALMLFVSRIRYQVIKKCSVLIYIVACVLLLFVLVRGVAAGEAKRWIYIGPISVQPSEIMKLALILMLAYYFDKNYRKVSISGHFWKSTLHGIVFPMFFVAIACGLILAENHLSGTIIVFLIGMTVIWAGGGKWQWYMIFLVAATVLVIAVLLFSDKLFSIFPTYVQRRVDMWLHPENYSVQNDTWQTVQGKIAVGSGGWFGRGLGNSLQKHLFVSQPQNDFIFAIVCEELGFVGAVGVIILYGAFIVRGLKISSKAPDLYAAVTVVGIVGHVATQTLLNIGVVTGVLPNTGISLPFFSYGGSSLVILMIEMGVLLSISKYSKIPK